MDPIPENNRAAWYQGPMKLEVVKSCVFSEINSWREDTLDMTHPSLIACYDISSSICLHLATGENPFMLMKSNHKLQTFTSSWSLIYMT